MTRCLATSNMGMAPNICISYRGKKKTKQRLLMLASLKIQLNLQLYFHGTPLKPVEDNKMNHNG